MIKFLRQRRYNRPISTAKPAVDIEQTNIEGENTAVQMNNEIKENKNMEFETIKTVADSMAPETKIKKVKKDKGLIERTESSKTIITEDYKQILMD